MTSPPPPLEQSAGRHRQPEAPTHGYALLAAPREGARPRAPESRPPLAEPARPPRAGFWVRADTSAPPREESVRHDPYPPAGRRHGASRPPERGEGPAEGQDPPLYRALMARWAERGVALPLRGDPEWARLAAPPGPWFSGPRPPAGGAR